MSRPLAERPVVEVAPVTGHEVVRARTRSGAEVVVVVMPGFSSAFAVLATRFGSIDDRLPDGRRLPAGTAHFLEHVMFQKETGDLFDVFEARGAASNAYTTFHHTAYLFACTHDLDENLATLLESVARLEVDAPRIERERAIIGQEIALYADDAAWRAAFGLYRALYRAHPVRDDIVGDRASVARIRRPLLQAAHAAYYAPGNLVLAVAGDVDPGRVIVAAERRLGPARGRARRAPRRAAEPAAVARAEVRARLPVGRTHVVLGLKDRPRANGPARIRRHVETALVLDLLFGDGGRVEAPLYREGVVDDSLSAIYEDEIDFAHVVVSAEVDDEARYRARLLRALDEAGARPFGRDELDRVRRRARGRFLRTFNAPESAAYWALGHALDRAPLGARVGALDRAAPAALDRRLATLLRLPRAWSIVTPPVEATGRRRRIPVR